MLFCLPKHNAKGRTNHEETYEWRASELRTKHFDVNFITETSSLRQLQRKTLRSAVSASSWAGMRAWHEHVTSDCWRRSCTSRSYILRYSKPNTMYDTHTSLAKRTFAKQSVQESMQRREREWESWSQQAQTAHQRSSSCSCFLFTMVSLLCLVFACIEPPL